MNFIGIDLEGVLIPEIWVSLSEKTGIEELKLTTKDISDYKELMKIRIGLLRKNHINSNLLFDIASDIDIGKVDPQHLFDTLVKIDLTKSDALFVSCTALPVLSIIKDLEKKMGKVILSSNQTLIWDTLKQINFKNEVAGYGELFNN